MNVLLTGATGFVGKRLLSLLLENGHRVGALILPAEHPPGAFAENPGVTWIPGALADPPWRLIEQFRPEACVHSAWIASPGVYLESPENDRYLSWSGEFLARLPGLGVSHLVALGTCLEYRIGPEPLNEDTTPAQPVSRYAKCKNQLRLVLEEIARNYGARYCWCRLFYPYGPGEHPSRLCSQVIAKLARGEKVPLNTPDSMKDYIHIDDVARALQTILVQRGERIVNIGTGVGVRVGEMARIIARQMGREELLVFPSSPTEDPHPCVVSDNRRLLTLGWSSRVALEAGLAEMTRKTC